MPRDEQRDVIERELISDLIDLNERVTHALTEAKYAISNDTGDLSEVVEAIKELEDDLNHKDLKDSLDYLTEYYYGKNKNFFEGINEQE